MKITLIGHYPPPYGGVAVLMKQMENALSLRGFRIFIFNLGQGRPAGGNVVNFNTSNRVLEFFQLLKAFAFSDADVFHYLSASYRSFWLGAVCVTLARVTGHKIVISLVGGAFSDFINGLGPFAKRLARHALKGAHFVVTCNSEIEEALLLLGVKERVTRMSNCFPPLIQPTAGLPRNVDDFVSSHTPVLSSTGAACAEYGLTSLLEAVKILRREHPRIGLVLALTRYGDETSEKELFGAVEGLGLKDHVLIERELPDFIALLKRSDALVRSALVDGDSVSVREGLFLGLPTVASDTPFRPEGVVLFRKGDAADMAEKLEEVLKVGRGCLASSAQKESEENMETLIRIYSNVVGSEPPPRPYAGPNSAQHKTNL